jgi:flagellar hook-associated protein 2
MSTLRLPGLLTGIDTTALIAQMMAVERRTLNVYEQRKKLWGDRNDALGTLETKLTNLRSGVSALSDADQLRAYKVASSDTDKVTATASYNAFEGSHNIVINQLATAERWVHTNGLEYVEDYVDQSGDGTFMYSYNNTQTVIETTATTTLEDLVGLINNDANNPGVTASLLYYNGTYHLVLNGNEAGSDYKITVDGSSIEVLESNSEFTDGSDNATLETKITDLDQFTLNGGLLSDTEIQITGDNHNGVAIFGVNVPVTDNTKISHLIDEINDAFDGIAVAKFENGKIVLTDEAEGASSLSLVLTYNPGAGGDSELDGLSMGVSTTGGAQTADLANFALSDFTQSQTAQNSLIKVDGYPSGSATAEVQRLSSNSPPSSGTYNLTYQGETTADLDAKATPAEILTALEALSTINVGDITSVDGGGQGLNDGDVTINFLDTLGDVSMISIVDNLNPPSTVVTITEDTRGALGWISRSSNTIDDVIHGVTLHLQDTTDANGEDITLTRDVDSLKEKINAMVNGYNFAIQHIKEKTGYNDILETAGILMGDYVVSTIRNQLSMPLIRQTSGFVTDLDTFLMPGQIGLELDREGMLSLDANALDTAIDEDYLGVLAVIGADKTGTSDSNVVEFYGASSEYTTAGTYDVEVVVAGGAITSAKIKLSTESTYRNMTIGGNIVTGDSTFDDNSDPVYPEHSLQLSVDLTQSGTHTVAVRVKQGFAGAIEDALDNMLKVTTGSIQIDQEHAGDIIEGLEDKIKNEQERLEGIEDRLVGRFARLEKALALIQNQLIMLGMG